MSSSKCNAQLRGAYVCRNSKARYPMPFCLPPNCVTALCTTKRTPDHTIPQAQTVKSAKLATYPLPVVGTRHPLANSYALCPLWSASYHALVCRSNLYLGPAAALVRFLRQLGGPCRRSTCAIGAWLGLIAGSTEVALADSTFPARQLGQLRQSASPYFEPRL